MPTMLTEYIATSPAEMISAKKQKRLMTRNLLGSIDAVSSLLLSLGNRTTKESPICVH